MVISSLYLVFNFDGRYYFEKLGIFVKREIACSKCPFSLILNRIINLNILWHIQKLKNILYFFLYVSKKKRIRLIKQQQKNNQNENFGYKYFFFK
jgi:hypothetical protein